MEQTGSTLRGLGLLLKIGRCLFMLYHSPTSVFSCIFFAKNRCLFTVSGKHWSPGELFSCNLFASFPRLDHRKMSVKTFVIVLRNKL